MSITHVTECYKPFLIHLIEGFVLIELMCGSLAQRYDKRRGLVLFLLKNITSAQRAHTNALKSQNIK